MVNARPATDAGNEHGEHGEVHDRHGSDGQKSQELHNDAPKAEHATRVVDMVGRRIANMGAECALLLLCRRLVHCRGESIEVNLRLVESGRPL